MATPEPVADVSPRPFHFWGCSEIRESLGVRADSLQQLLERLETVTADAIYYHSVRCLLRHQVVAPAFPDDFATWVDTEVREPALAEKLAFHSPFDFADTEAFREHLIGVLDDHLRNQPWVGGRVPAGPFRFLRGHLAAVPLDVTVRDLPELRFALAQVDESSIYYHTVEAVGRLGNPRGDFASWIEDELGFETLARRVQEIDPFVASLSEVRVQLLRAVDAEIEGRVA
jgi:Family of unknown function (DUF5752)